MTTKSKLLQSKDITLEEIPGGIKIRKGSKAYVMSGTSVEKLSAQLGKAFFIEGQVPSKKNSKGVMISNTTGKPILRLSKQYQRYEKSTANQFTSILPYFLMSCSMHTKPYNIKLSFIRKNNQLFDYFGPAETIADLMVKHGLLDDDNVREVKFFFGDFTIDATHPGVLIEFLPDGKII